MRTRLCSCGNLRWWHCQSSLAVVAVAADAAGAGLVRLCSEAGAGWPLEEWLPVRDQRGERYGQRVQRLECWLRCLKRRRGDAYGYHGAGGADLGGRP